MLPSDPVSPLALFSLANSASFSFGELMAPGGRMFGAPVTENPLLGSAEEALRLLFGDDASISSCNGVGISSDRNNSNNNSLGVQWRPLGVSSSSLAASAEKREGEEEFSQLRALRDTALGAVRGAWPSSPPSPSPSAPTWLSAASEAASSSVGGDELRVGPPGGQLVDVARRGGPLGGKLRGGG